MTLFRHQPVQIYSDIAEINYHIWDKPDTWYRQAGKCNRQAVKLTDRPVARWMESLQGLGTVEGLLPTGWETTTNSNQPCKHGADPEKIPSYRLVDSSGMAPLRTADILVNLFDVLFYINMVYVKKTGYNKTHFYLWFKDITYLLKVSWIKNRIKSQEYIFVVVV